MASDRLAPIWQRMFCGLLAVGGALAVPLNAIHAGHSGWHLVVSSAVAAYGLFLFGHIALRGKLPGKVPGTAYVRFRHTSGQRNP